MRTEQTEVTREQLEEIVAEAVRDYMPGRSGSKFLDFFKGKGGRSRQGGSGGGKSLADKLKNKYGEPGGEKESDKDKAGEDDIEKGDSFAYTSKTGNKSAVTVVDPENENGVTVAVKIDPNTCAPKKGSQFVAKPEAFADQAGKPIDKCSGEQGAKRAASAPGKKTPVSIVRPGQKGETSLAQYFQQVGVGKTSAGALAQQVAKYLGGKKIPVAEVATMLHEQEQVQKGKSYLYTTDTGKNKGKKTPVVVLDPKNQNNATYVQRLKPDSCEPISGAEFAPSADKFPDRSEPHDKCNLVDYEKDATTIGKIVARFLIDNEEMLSKDSGLQNIVRDEQKLQKLISRATKMLARQLNRRGYTKNQLAKLFEEQRS